MTVAALIVAAGRGHRLGGETPKQYLPLAGRSSLRRSVEAFLVVPEVSHVQIVIHKDDVGLYRESLSGLQDARLITEAFGGKTRALSVRNGLDALAVHRPQNVLIHDAARPFVTPELIKRMISALDASKCVCAAVPVVDAVWRAEADLVKEAVSREGLWRAQTPQGFDFKSIYGRASPSRRDRGRRCLGRA